VKEAKCGEHNVIELSVRC